MQRPQLAEQGLGAPVAFRAWSVLAIWFMLAFGVSAAETNSPPVPKPTSPIAYFRKLLAMSDSERAVELAKRPEPQREVLAAKVEEYANMPADERELRLRATELRFYLTPLMHAKPEQYDMLLKNVPDDIRDLVESRLVQWKLIPPMLKDQLLENEATLRLFTRMNPLSPPSADDLMNQLPAAQREKIAADMQHWQTLSPGEQSQALRTFKNFFELTDTERDRTLKTLSPEEQEAMQAAIRKFDHLPPGQRLACVRGFEKYASMSAVDRAQFLRNAEKWQAMSPQERQQWREVVNRVSQMPPLPPGVESVIVRDTPPLPPGVEPVSAPSLTN